MGINFFIRVSNKRKNNIMSYLAPSRMRDFKFEARFVTLAFPPRQTVIPVKIALFPPEQNYNNLIN